MRIKNKRSILYIALAVMLLLGTMTSMGFGADAGKIVVTKTVENGQGVNGTFYFKLQTKNSSNQWVDTGKPLLSISITNGTLESKTLAWDDLAFGDYRVVETDSNGTALSVGDTSFGKELIEIDDSKATVTLSATSGSSVKITPNNIKWEDGTDANFFGSASQFNGLVFGNVKDLIDVEGNLAVNGDFTNEHYGYSGGGQRPGPNYLDHKKEIALLLNGNTSIEGSLAMVGQVVTNDTKSLRTKGNASYKITSEGETKSNLENLYGVNLSQGSAIEDFSNSGYYLVNSWLGGFVERPSIKASNTSMTKFFADAKSYMDNLQDTLGSKQQTGTVTEPAKAAGGSNQIASWSPYILTGTNSDVNVFNLTLDDGDGNPNVTNLQTCPIYIDCPEGSTVIVNIKNTGEIKTGTATWGSKKNQDGTAFDRERTIFNLENCSKITTEYSTVFYGSMLAPDTDLDVMGSGNIEGHAVFDDVSILNRGGFEFHNYKFKGGSNDVVITNVFKGNFEFEISKISDKTRGSLAGAEFALYADANCTGPVIQVGSEAAGGIHKFSNLPAGTYYMKETKAPSGYAATSHIYTVVISDLGVVTIDGSVLAAGVSYPVPNPESGKIHVTKKVLVNDKEQISNDTFYVALFSDPECKNLIQGPKALRMNGASSTTVTFDNLEHRTYYVAETDASGKVLLAADISATNIKYDSNKTITISPQKPEGSTEILNCYDTGKINVTKVVKTDGEETPTTLTYYAALFSDAECKNRVTEVKRLYMNGNSATTVSFTDLAPGTYYLAETTVNGVAISDPQEVGATDILYTNKTMTIAPSNIEANARITNSYDSEFMLGSLEVTKKTTVNGKKYNSQQTFYVALFEDEACTQIVSEVKALKMNGNSSTRVSFTNLEMKTYYVAETDVDGNAISDPQEIGASDIVYNNKTVEISPENLSGRTIINNQYDDREYYYKTGDRSNMLLPGALALLALAGIIGLIASKRRRL